MRLSVIMASVCVAFGFAACQQATEYTFVQYNVGVFAKYDDSSYAL